MHRLSVTLLGLALTVPSLRAQAPAQPLELDRKGETIVLEAYAPNILRVTLSLQHDPAVAKPGYGFVASPETSGWTASQTGKADVLPVFADCGDSRTS